MIDLLPLMKQRRRGLVLAVEPFHCLRRSAEECEGEARSRTLGFLGTLDDDTRVQDCKNMMRGSELRKIKPGA